MIQIHGPETYRRTCGVPKLRPKLLKSCSQDKVEKSKSEPLAARTDSAIDPFPLMNHIQRRGSPHVSGESVRDSKTCRDEATFRGMHSVADCWRPVLPGREKMTYDQAKLRVMEGMCRRQSEGFWQTGRKAI